MARPWRAALLAAALLALLAAHHWRGWWVPALQRQMQDQERRPIRQLDDDDVARADVERAQPRGDALDLLGDLPVGVPATDLVDDEFAARIARGDRRLSAHDASRSDYPTCGVAPSPEHATVVVASTLVH